ncbi:predicted protein [Uncinocarpus reesii 1704]|uniref:Uncharacterized protein n=1 Tax=Uncinocarpus reesii (strain UAMH 1704) TaxID=336963 RepID=C4JG16_UNCRE|nr:uncharacterized protein UREG_01096 [Uncinocarpus reesii 1704]EEP76247.1 predicted protein [Uncinocarpus reesii 1704]
MFAEWWSMQPDMPDEAMTLSAETPEEHLPYLNPHWADSETYLELARRKPSMMPQIARACIVIGNPLVGKAIDPTPDWFLLYEAERDDRNPFFREDIMRWTRDMAIDLSETALERDAWKDMRPGTIHAWRGYVAASPESVRWTVFDHQPETWFYNERGVNMSEFGVVDQYAGGMAGNGERRDSAVYYAQVRDELSPGCRRKVDSQKMTGKITT